MNNETVEIFRAVSGQFQQMQANTGHGRQGEWPPHSQALTQQVLGMQIEKGNFNKGGGEMIPCVNVSFLYQWHDDPLVDRAEPLEWHGSVMPVVSVEGLADNVALRARIGMERLKGHLTKVLGPQYTGVLDQDIQLCHDLLAGDSAVMATVYIKAREGRDGTVYKDEFIQQILSAA